MDAAIPCGLMINELVTNALKYAFPPDRFPQNDFTCSIVITVTCNQNEYALSVADNGAGLPDGVNLNTTKSLGLRLVRLLGQHQLQGTLDLDGASGTCVTLRFNAQPPERSTAHGSEDHPDRRG